MPESWPDLGHQWVDALLTPVSFVILTAGVLGLIVGFLVGKGSEYEDPPTENAAGAPELQWRHEKLVLWERQRAEEQLRRDRFADAVSGEGGATDSAIKSRYFALAETLREERQRTGSELSRFELLDERLAAIAGAGGPRLDAVSGCREIAGSRTEQLKQNREALRSAGKSFFALESEILTQGELPAETRNTLSTVTDETEALVLALPAEVSEADGQLREILAAGGESEFAAIRNILLVDGAETASLKNDTNRVTDAVGSLKAALALRGEEVEARADDTAKIPATDLPDPDEGFVEPTTPSAEPPTNGFHDWAKDTVTVPLPESESEPSVIFRSNDAALWGRTVYRGANSRARALANFPKWAKWVSITRLDTSERVFASADSATLKSGEGGSAFGFNGTNELFYGARHLGIFAESCPNEVETRFTYGGWGFGHRVKDAGSESEPLQASGWEGREIDADTVFEISLHAGLPEIGKSDKVLDAN